jgi:hypothetical protein
MISYVSLHSASHKCCRCLHPIYSIPKLFKHRFNHTWQVTCFHSPGVCGNVAIDSVPANYLHDDVSGDELGHDAVGASPLATQYPVCHIPPHRWVSALQSSSFAPMLSNPVPTIRDAVKADPDFFEGTNQDSVCPGPHFIAMSFIKDKMRIRDQLITALTSTVSILCAHLPDTLIHCIQKDQKLPPLSSATCDNFSSTGMQARNYMFIQNSWSLNPGVRNKPKLPMQKFGKDGRPVFDKNRGYNGPGRITSIMRVSALCYVKEALNGTGRQESTDLLEADPEKEHKKSNCALWTAARL